MSTLYKMWQCAMEQQQLSKVDQYFAFALYRTVAQEGERRCAAILKAMRSDREPSKMDEYSDALRMSMCSSRSEAWYHVMHENGRLAEAEEFLELAEGEVDLLQVYERDRAHAQALMAVRLEIAVLYINDAVDMYLSGDCDNAYPELKETVDMCMAWGLESASFPKLYDGKTFGQIWLEARHDRAAKILEMLDTRGYPAPKYDRIYAEVLAHHGVTQEGIDAYAAAQEVAWKEFSASD